MSKTKKEFTRFFIRLSIAAAILFLIASPLLYFNIIIDPYGVFLDHNEYVYFTNENNKRLGKIKYVLKYPDRFTNFIFGSSRVNFINGDHFGEEKFFNMTASAAAPKDHLRDLKIMINGGVTVKKVVIGVDFLSFFYQGMVDQMRLLRFPYPLSIREHYDFYKNYLLNVPPKELLNEQIKNHEINRQVRIGNGIFASKNLDSLILSDPYRHNRSMSLRIPASDYKNPQEFGAGLNDLRELVNFLKSQQIEYVIFVHATHVSTYLTLNINSYLEMLKEMAEITEYVDFSGLNSICINNLNFIEPSHYTERIGDLIISRVNGMSNPKLPHDFGFFINKSNIEEHLERHRRWIGDYFGSICLNQDFWKKKIPANTNKIILSEKKILSRIDGLSKSSLDDTILVTAPYLRLTLKRPTKNNWIPVVFIDHKVFSWQNDSGTIHQPPVRIVEKNEWEMLIPAQKLDSGFHKLTPGFYDTTSGVYLKSDETTGIFVHHAIDYPKTSDLTIIHKPKAANRVIFKLDLVNGKSNVQQDYQADDPWMNLSGWSIDTRTKEYIEGLVILVNDQVYPICFIRQRKDLQERFNNPLSRFGGWVFTVPLSDQSRVSHIRFGKLSKDKKSVVMIGKEIFIFRNKFHSNAL